MTSMITSGKVRMRQILTYLCLCADWLCTQNMWLKCWPTCACVCWLCISKMCDWNVDIYMCACVCWLCTPKVHDWSVDQLVPVSVDYAHPKYMTEMLTSLCLCMLIMHTQSIWLKCWPACACVYWLCTPRICDWNVGQLVPVYTLYDDVAGRCHWDVDLLVLVCLYYQKVRQKCWPTFTWCVTVSFV